LIAARDLEAAVVQPDEVSASVIADVPLNLDS
jgi:hypothetical protein